MGPVHRNQVTKGVQALHDRYMQSELASALPCRLLCRLPQSMSCPSSGYGPTRDHPSLHNFLLA